MSFTLGQEARMNLTVVDPTTKTSVPITLGIVKNFDVKPKHETTTVEGVNNNGKPASRDSFHGWDISFTVTRQSGILSKLAQIYQDNYYAGGPQIFATFSQTVKNPNGTVEQHQYPESVLNIKDLGSFANAKEVDEQFTAFCPERKETKAGTVLG